jgi:hypothetical protein
MVFQNCGGTRIRTANLTVSRSQVDGQLSAIKSANVSSSSTSASDLQKFFSILDAEGSTLFYAEAPGSMGNLNVVMPIDFETMGIQKPTKAYAYFAFVKTDAGSKGALLITSEASSPAASPSPSSSPAEASTSSGSGGQTPLVVLVNDGTKLSLGQFSEGQFNLETDFQGQSSVFLNTDDVVDDDLAEVIQFELTSQLQSGEEVSLGLINLAHPLN